MRRQTALLEASRSISTALDTQPILTELTRALCEGLDATSAYICDWDPKTGISTVLADYFAPTAHPGEMESDVGQTFNLIEQTPGFVECLREDRTEILHVDDPSISDFDRSHMTENGAHTTVAIPLRMKDRIFGYVEIWESRRRREFTKEEIRLAESIARHAVAVLEKAELFQEAETNLRRQTALLEASRLLSTSLDTDTILSNLAQAMCNGMDATSTAIMDWDQDTGLSRVIADYSSPEGSAKEIPSDLGDVWHLPTQDPGLIDQLMKFGLETVHVDDPDLTDVLRDNLREYGGISVLTVPLRVRDQIFGYAEVWESRRRREFTEEEIRLAESIAHNAASVLENTELFQESQTNLRRQTALLEASRLLSTSLDTDTILSNLAQAMCNGMDATSTSICDWDQNTGLSRVIANYSSPEASAKENPSYVGAVFHLPTLFPGLIDQLMKFGMEIVHVDDPDLADFPRDHLREYGAISVLTVPIRVRDKFFGYVVVWESRSRREFAEEEIRLAQSIAYNAASVLENAELYQQAETSREQAQARAQELETIINTSPVGLVLLDTDMTVRWINGFTSTLYALKPSQVIGKAWYSVVPTGLDYQHIHKRVLKGESIELDDDPYRGSNQLRYHDLRYRPLLDADGTVTGMLIVIIDVTDRVTQEERFRETARLAALGELAAGVAHEVNNPLTTVVGYAGLLKARNLPEEASRDVDRILAAGQRTAKIVKNLLSFARRRDPEKSSVDLESILRSTLDLKSHDLHTHQIEVVTEFQPDVPKTMADAHQLEQVFLNILTNAEQAMANAQQGDTIRIDLWHENDQIRIGFADQGPGIPEDVSRKIFDPFFSTKEVGMGTGLGLSICHGIMREHGGRIWAEKNAGAGVTFHLSLPIIRSGITDSGSNEALPPADSYQAQVLVVDDEESVRELVKESLSNQGFSVHQASDGLQAKKEIEVGSYDCIVLDIKMPGLDGMELYRWIRRWNEDLASKVVFISGDSIAPATKDFLDRIDNPVVTKPFSLGVLRTEMERVLDQPN